jgi:hypothetical protein
MDGESSESTETLVVMDHDQAIFNPNQSVRAGNMATQNSSGVVDQKQTSKYLFITLQKQI